MVRFRRAPPEGDTRRPATITPAARGWPWRQTPSPATGWTALYGRHLRGRKTASRKGDVSDVAGEFCDNRTIIPGNASTASWPFESQGSSRRTQRIHKGHDGAGGSAAPARETPWDRMAGKAPRRVPGARSRRVLRAFFVVVVMNRPTAASRHCGGQSPSVSPASPSIHLPIRKGEQGGDGGRQCTVDGASTSTPSETGVIGTETEGPALGKLLSSRLGARPFSSRSLIS